MKRAPIVCEHDGIGVVRDDLYPGGTKARFLAAMFDGTDELVYASPAEGGAQFALATIARSLGKRATIFVAARAKPHARAIEAKALGARVCQITPGHLTVVQARARAYSEAAGARLVPFGADSPLALEAIRRAAMETGEAPDEVWCAAGSGVLARGLALAWPAAARHVVQVGRALVPADVAGATIHAYPLPFAKECPIAGPFPADLHYDAKAWAVCHEKRARKGRVLFWNVTGPAGSVSA